MLKHIRSHFRFSKQQRSGIFLLVLIIIVLQLIYVFVNVPSKETAYSEDEMAAFRLEVETLEQIAIASKKPKLYPFNPNFVTDYKGYTLGMTNDEIDRLHAYRNKGLWINSIAQFQKVTKVSDTLLQKISPYFKFPEWVTNPKSNNYKTSNIKQYQPKTYAQKSDLNTATAEQLQNVNGIGEKLSERIIKYRNKFKGGFVDDVELKAVYGLKPEVIERITNDFTVKTPRQILKMNINTATIEQLVTIPYIDYEVAYQIIEQRTLREGFKSIEELTKIEEFPVKKYDIIKLYLQF